MNSPHPKIIASRWLSLLAIGLGLAGMAMHVEASTGERQPPYSVRMWQKDDGLPQSSVFAIAQTPEGYLWVGTPEGLVRFDGIRFTLPEEMNLPEFKDASIRALLGSRDGSLWIGTDANGLTQIRQGKALHYTETNGLPNNQIRCLMEGRDGSIWIGTEGGVARFQGGKFSTLTDKNGLADVSVRAVCEDRRGVIRIATRRGLSELSPGGSLRTINFGSGAVANTLKSVGVDRVGNVWVTSNEGVTCQGETETRFFTQHEGLPSNIATVLFLDTFGRIWAGTYAGVASFVDGKVVSRPMNDAGLGDLVNVIFEDREQNLWIGARDGLYRLIPARFTTFTVREGLSSDNVMSVLEDRAGALWVATWGGGLNCIKDNRITVLSDTNGLTHNKALSLCAAHDGSIWAGMDFDGGLNRLPDLGSNTFPRTTGLLNAPIRVIHEDRNGALWIGTGRGLNIFQQGKFATFTSTNGLAGNNVTVIHEDALGRIWLGTDGGLSRWEGGHFTNFTTAQGLSHNYVNAIYEDADHAFWIGTLGGGLNRCRDDQFTSYTTREGLFSDQVYEVIEDDVGELWMTCRKGIFRVRKAEFTLLDQNAIGSLTSIAFGKADGLVSEQFNGVAKPSAWKARDGRIWFPTIRGLVAVEPGAEANREPPPVVIEEVIADHDRLPWLAGDGANAPTLTIPPGGGDLEIRYTALSFPAPERNRFKYQLEGFDPAWNDAGDERVARYFNLNPGRYRFRVIASNDDGVWNNAGAVVALIIQPHVWQTWWFKFALFLSAGLPLVIWYRNRMARLREIENLRVQIAADLHDDVGARLTKVAMMTELLDGETMDADRNKPHIQSISRTTREIIQAMDEIVWTINPKNDTLDNLANYIFHYAQDYFQNSGVRCRLDFPARLPERTMSTEERHNIFMAVKEALNNVLKHARATEVRIRLAVQDDQLMISIADDGCGFPKVQTMPAGDGLENMKSRLAGIGGQVILENAPGGGAVVQLKV